MESQDIDKPKKATRSAEIEQLTERVESLTLALQMISHYTGNDRILLELGIDRYVPGADKLRKARGDRWA